ncbi:MAG: hypothetical protein Q7U28_08065 [Aquabacterium sp.]|nr:hypothetical protein [Aquabacterium sp.]
MNKPIYTPRADSLASRVIAFFQRNPDEELSLEEISEKYDAGRSNIHTQLGGAIDAGMLVRDRDVDGDYIYKPGTALPAPHASSGLDMDAVHRKAPPPAKADKPIKPARVRVAFPDPEAVPIDTDVPVPSSNKPAKHDWMPLLQRLQPGESCKLPIQARPTLAAKVTTAHKEKLGTFTMRNLPETNELRLWRTA